MERGLQIDTPIYKKPKRLKIHWMPIAFLIPSILSYLIFKYYPLAYMLYISFYDYSLLNPPGLFIGLDNYFSFLDSPRFWQAVRNTFVFFLLSVGLVFWVPIFQALLLNHIRRGNAFFRFMYQIPTIIPLVAGVLVWKWMYNPDRGLLNYLLEKVGLGPYGWLNDLQITKLAIVIPGFFWAGGIALLLYYSAIRSISEDVIEAGRMDGAGPWNRMLTIILPNIKFIIVIQFIAFMSGVLLAYDNIQVMTQGGPADSTLVVSMLIVSSGFDDQHFGLSGAISVFMFIVIALLTVLQNKFTEDKE